MKRLIKYWSSYNETEFSTCSTKYEVLSEVVSDDADLKDLRLLAQLNSIEVKGLGKTVKPKSSWGYSKLEVTHYIETTEVYTTSAFHNRTEHHPVYLGFITLSEVSSLPLSEKPDKKLTKEQANELVNCGSTDARNTAELGTDYLLIIDSWKHFHILNLWGYSQDDFYKKLGVDGYVFNDEVSNCSNCGEYDFNDDGHTYNFREFDGEYLGLNCGCYKKATEENFSANANNPEKCIERETCEKLEERGKLVHLKQYVGGLTDSWRSHSYNGEQAEIGTPETILKDLLTKNPDGQFIFSHDESGQFQTYFSVWQIKEN